MDKQIRMIKDWLGSGSINFFGPPFSGKDTQAKRLAELFDGVVVSGGDILRHSRDNSEIQKIMAEGGMIPPAVFLKIIPPFFEQAELAGKPLFLSSLGRLLEETTEVLKAARGSGHEMKAAILLQLPEASIWRHFENAKNLNDRGQRADDTKQALSIRLDQFKRTAPVIEYYKDQGLLSEVDDSQPVEEVTREILDTLTLRAES